MAESQNFQTLCDHVTNEKGSYSQRLDVTMTTYLALIASLPDKRVAPSQKSEAAPEHTTLSQWVR